MQIGTEQEPIANDGSRTIGRAGTGFENGYALLCCCDARATDTAGSPLRASTY